MFGVKNRYFMYEFCWLFFIDDVDGGEVLSIALFTIIII